MHIPYRPLALGLLVLGFSAVVLNRAQAGGSHFYPPVSNGVVKEECGSCHLAFPASMLPASAWTRMMADLKNHFGDDASIDPELATRLAGISGGTVATTGHEEDILKLFGPATREITVRRETSPWDNWYMLLLATGAMTAEWILRRRSGLA